MFSESSSGPVGRLRRHPTLGIARATCFSGMAKQEGLEIARVSKAFANDILLALSCRESGCVLVTENDRDFSRIRQFISFEYMKPWPAYDLRLVGSLKHSPPTGRR